MSSSAEVRAWNAFWDEQGPDDRCLRAAPDRIYRLLSNHWSGFAIKLAPRTQVLDIGCGTGVAARSLIGANSALRVVGIDVAQVRTRNDDPRVRILPGQAIEATPFPDASFGAAVSQFGYEYSEVQAAAKELARVLQPGARFSFIVHHSESWIVRGDRLHNRALRAVTSDIIRVPFLSGDALGLTEELRGLQRRFPDETTVWLLARGLLERILGTAEERLRLWNAVTEAIAPDLTLAEALESSCIAQQRIDDWLQLLQRKFELSPPSLLLDDGQPLAWKIEGVRSAH
jgi:SAM-dependent methyltransferase